MSDSLVYQLAADLADFLSDQVALITLPTGCDAPERIYTSAGQPDAANCGEIAVWATMVSPTDIPNREVTVDQSFCANATFVEVTWRYTGCISKSPDGKTPISVATHEADAECFYTLVYALYRRIAVNIGTVFTDVSDCKKITGGSLEVGDRLGGQLSASQSFRIGIDLTDPATDSS